MKHERLRLLAHGPDGTRWEAPILRIEGLCLRFEEPALTDPIALALEGEHRAAIVDEAMLVLAHAVIRIASRDETGVSADLLAIGIDGELAQELGRRLGLPPPLPPRLLSEPPMVVDDLVEEAAIAEKRQLVVERKGVVIGIDLGTTNTCASYVVDGQPRVIPGRTGTSTIPSMITFELDGAFHIGQRAADRHVLHPSRTVYGSKRQIGRASCRERVS
jgi:hypothetical protein